MGTYVSPPQSAEVPKDVNKVMARFVRIHRLRQTLPWPRARFDAMLETLRAEQHIVLEEGLPGAISAGDIQASYHVHGRLYITRHWRDSDRPAPPSPSVPTRRAPLTPG